MKKTLIQLPDWKKAPVTVGREYEILKEFGNAYVIKSDDDMSIMILQSRFQ